MGASGSIQAGLAALGEDMSENLRQLDLAKGELAKADEELYKSESNKLFKDHQVMIELFTKKSKSQLAKLVQDTSIRTSDVDKLLGSDYGKFMSSLTEDSVTIDLRLAKLAMTGMGADEELLVALFCTRSAAEIQAIAAAFERETNTKLLDKVKARTFKDPKFYNNLLGEFFSKILAGDRFEGSFVDVEAAKNHAVIINNTKANEISSILDIICYNSRAYCASMNEALKTQFNISLEELLKEKIGKVVSYEALRFWCMPLPEAYASMLQKYSSRTEIIFYTLARLGKGDLSAINKACIARTTKPLKDVIDSGISGNLKRAVVSWIEQPPFDGGCEDELNAWLVEQSAAGYTLDQLMGNSESYDYVVGNVQAQIQAYKDAGFGRNIAIKKVQSEKNMKKSASSLSVASQSEEASSSPTIISESQSYEHKSMKVKEFLSYIFTLCDTDGSDEMSTEEFNAFLAHLTLSDFGYTQDELDIMLSFCDADGSGFVSFSEVVNEMTDALINGIENSGFDLMQKIDEMFNEKKMGAASQKELQGKSRKSKKSQSSKGVPAAATEALTLPQDLESFLVDSFQGFDLDQNGVLDKKEFVNLMNSLGLGLSNEDIDNLQAKWDIDVDGCVNWKESLPMFVDLLHGMASDERDHYIGLYDKTSGYLFWYNLRDKSSQWMSEEDQATYAPGARNVDDQ